MSYLKQVHQKNKSDLVRVHELPNENKIYGKIANYSSVETSNYTNNSKISNSNSYQNYAQKNIFGAMQNLNKSTINNNSNKSNTEISNVNELSKKIELIKNQQKKCIDK